MGSRHDEIGLLDRQGTEFLLHRSGGGRWRLDVGLINGWRMGRMVGHRVRLMGIRVAFDVLDVGTVETVRYSGRS